MDMTRTCCDKILDLVSGLGLNKGDRLPGEREIAERLGYSRNTVRESLVALAARGQIEIRKRSGCYLISTTPTTPWSNLRADVEATLGALCAVGPYLAARVGEHAPPMQVRRLEEVTARIGQHMVNQKAAAFVEEYVNFYAVLAEFAANPYLELLMKEIVAGRECLMSAVTMDKAKTDSFFELHVSLLQAIQTHDTHRAQSLSAHGLNAFSSMLETRPPSLLNAKNQ